RDLEPGARRFYSAYADVTYLDPKGKDPLVRSWLGERHHAATRLIRHCRDQYDVRFRLGYSVRPWARAPAEAKISGSDGVLWHAVGVPGPDEAPPAELWRELSAEVRELLVHLLFSGMTISASFAAVDDPAAVADAIGETFDRVVETGRRFPIRVGR